MSQPTNPTAAATARSDGAAVDSGWQPRQIAAVAIVAVCGVIVALISGAMPA